MDGSAAQAPLVTVVTACLEPGPRLKMCLNSVANQSYREIEHIVVDGGSTDGTLQLLEASGVDYTSEADVSQTEALNKGFRRAAGQLLTWLNADDELLPDAVHTVVRAIRGNRNTKWVFGDCEVVNATGRLERTIRPPAALGRRSFDQGNVLAQPGTFFTRDALFQVGCLDESFELAMDFDLWVRFVDAGFLSTYVPRTLARFHVHDRSKTGAVPPDQFLVEEARALLKSGRGLPGHVAIGRSTVLSIQPRNGPDRKRVIAEAADKSVPLEPWGATRGIAIAAALTESVLVDPSPRKLAYLLNPLVWKTRGMRKRALRGLRAILRVVSRGVKQARRVRSAKSR